MKRLIVFLFFCMFLISFASALEFDNKALYDPDKDTYTIRDSLLGIPTTKVADISRTGLEKIGASIVHLDFNYTLYEDNYADPFKYIRLDKLINGQWVTGEQVSFEILVKQGTKLEDEDVYTLSCSTDAKNLSNEICTSSKTGSRSITVDNYVPLNQTKLRSGDYEIRLILEKGLFDETDWILNLNGEELIEWDFLGNSLQGYWTFDSPDRTAAFNVDNNTINNFTAFINTPGKSTDAKLGAFAMQFNETDFDDLGNTTINATAVNANTAFSWSFWINHTGSLSEQKILAHPDVANGNRNIQIIPGTGDQVNFQLGDGSSNFGIQGTVSAGIYHLVVATAEEGDAIRLYIDNDNVANATFAGTFTDNGLPFVIGSKTEGQGTSGSNPFNGTLDEVGYWDVELTPAEVSTLWNGGAGLAFPNPQFPPGPDLNVSIELVSPTTGLSTINTSLNFEGNHTPLNGNLTNTTLIVWNPDNSEFGRNFTTVVGNLSNTTTLSLGGLTFGSGYEWNYFTCVQNATATFCDTNSTNSTFSIVGFEVLSTTFNGSTNETSRQRFQTNISTVASVLSVTARLNYNSTLFTSTVTCDSSSASCLITNDLDVLLTDNNLESQNKTFFWEITTFDGTDSTIENSSLFGQNVSRIHLAQCDGTFTDRSLNFTAVDERNFTRINPFSFQATFDAWLGGGDVKRVSNFTNPSIVEMNLCNVPTGEMFVDAIIDYSDVTNTTYTPRNYFFQNSTINTINRNISLFLLESGVSTTFILKVQDQNLLPVTNTLITIQRFDPGNNVFNTIQIARTDDNGATVGFFETETVDYRFIISKDNQTLLTTTAQKIVGETVPFTLIFTIGVVTTAPWDNFGNITNLTSSLVFNSTSEIVTYTYEDLSDIFEQGRLLVQLNNPSNTTNAVICNVTSVQSSAQLTCDVSAGLNASYVARGFITRSGNEATVNVLTFSINTFAAVAGSLGLLMGFFMILVAAFAFKFNEIAGTWMIVITVFFVNMMGLINFGLLAVTALFGVAILITVQFGK